MKILILGGTAEARQLAARLADAGQQVITSLAGRTRAPTLPAGRVRIGGFGGAEGLAAYLRSEGIARLVDATHPYAARISANANIASSNTGVPLLRLMRRPWEPAPGQNWTRVGSTEEAAAVLPRGANALLTTGHAGLDAFFRRQDCRFHVRLIEPTACPVPQHAHVMLSRPPYALADERALLQRLEITHLVSKNSGGGQTAAKLQAAAELGVEVVMIERPPYDPASEVDTVVAALEAIIGT